MPKSKSVPVISRRRDSAEAELQAGVAAAVGETDEHGRMPGETRARGQVPELDAEEQVNAERSAEPVAMVRDGNVTFVEPGDVQTHIKMGFARKEDEAVPVDSGE